MSDTLEQQTVLDFVLESEQHLESAMHLATAFRVAQRQIVVAMLDALEQKIEPSIDLKHPDGGLYNCKNEVFNSNYPGFKVWKGGWGSDLCVNLENQTREGITVIGIWRSQKPLDSTLDDALTVAFGKENMAGSRNRWWAWYKVLPPEYGNWKEAHALATMHFKQQEVVDHLAKEIWRIQRVASPVIEAHSSKK